MCLIKNKSADSILPIIEKHVLPGSIIHTDEAKVYKSLKKVKEYKHKSIVHKYKFVDYDQGIHTKHIDSYNNIVKLRI